MRSMTLSICTMTYTIILKPYPYKYYHTKSNLILISCIKYKFKDLIAINDHSYDAELEKN